MLCGYKKELLAARVTRKEFPHFASLDQNDLFVDGTIERIKQLSTTCPDSSLALATLAQLAQNAAWGWPHFYLAHVP